MGQTCGHGTTRHKNEYNLEHLEWYSSQIPTPQNRHDIDGDFNLGWSHGGCYVNTDLGTFEWTSKTAQN